MMRARSLGLMSLQGWKAGKTGGIPFCSLHPSSLTLHPFPAGCMADGASDEEAVANAQAVIQEWNDTPRTPLAAPSRSRAANPPAPGLRAGSRK
jgi:hypothetical protein